VGKGETENRHRYDVVATALRHCQKRIHIRVGGETDAEVKPADGKTEGGGGNIVVDG